MTSSQRTTDSAASAAGSAEPAPRRMTGFWPVAAVVALTVAGVAVGFTKVWNFDVHWHLASGQWMIQHHSVLGQDPFSVDPPPRWLNGHWLFQVFIAGLFALTGWNGLAVLKAFCSAGAIFAFVMALRRTIPTAWLILSGLVFLEIMQPRIRVRPEAFSMLFLTITIVLVDGVRRGGSPKRLWWMVPLMLVWANCQGLFMLGIAIAASSVLGAWLDRKLCRLLFGSDQPSNLLSQAAIIPLLAAAVMCLVTPWPVDLLLNPFVLARRISGQEFYYTYVVSELQPTYEALSSHVDAIIVVSVTAMVLLINMIVQGIRGRFIPLAHTAWLAAFIYLGLLARRNVSLLGPVCGYLLAVHGGQIIDRLIHRAPRLGRAGPFAAALMTLLAGVYAFAYASEWTHAERGLSQRFGPGRQDDNYPTEIARWLEKLPAEGDILVDGFGDAAAFIYYGGSRDEPVRKVYLDGRNEFHTLQRFIEVHKIRLELGTAFGAATVPLPSSVRFLYIRHNYPDALASVMQNPKRFRLVRLDDTGALFARLDWVGKSGQRSEDNIPDHPNIDEFDRPLGPDGLVTGVEHEQWRWYRQNPQGITYRLGSLYLGLGRKAWGKDAPAATPLQRQCMVIATRYLTSALNEGLAPRQEAIGSLAMACQQRASQAPRPSDAPVDLNYARALFLFREMGLTGMDSGNGQKLALERVRCHIDCRQIDLADETMKAILENLPPRQRVTPPETLSHLQHVIEEALIKSKALVEDRNIRRLPALERARELTAIDVGLVSQAIAALRTAPADDREAQLLLADLLLGSGEARQARKVLNRLAGGDAKGDWQIPLGLALCDWVEGKLFEAREAIRRIPAAGGAAAKYYLDEMNLQIGDAIANPATAY